MTTNVSTNDRAEEVTQLRKEQLNFFETCGLKVTKNLMYTHCVKNLNDAPTLHDKIVTTKKYYAELKS